MASLLDPSARGRVILVGAGPGDPGLLTVRAVEALKQADVLVHDGLVDPRVLDLAPRAHRISVAKQRARHTLSQEAINALIIAHVKTGAIVVRLKGGDPFIFGRGGEEVEHLREAGIECTVVNGITAGLAAVTTLGVPLTHRDHAQGVVFVTGHAKTGAGAAEDPTDWRALAATAYNARLTLVIYMGVSGAAHIERELLHGLPADTPVAVIQHASLPHQKHIATTLGRLQDGIAEAGLASPAVIVVGDVLRGLAAAETAVGATRFGT